MYRLSTTEDLSFFSAATVIQVCIGENEVVLNFDSDVRITVLADFSIKLPGRQIDTYEDPRTGGAGLVGLLSDTVETAEATGTGDLRLVFRSGAELVVLDSCELYESFWINGPNVEIIV